jgi:predicted DsbA family dithiol-disulfide isomerase
MFRATAARMTNFNINVISDPICPWCYIGKVRLEKAISLWKTTVPNGEQDSFTVTWHPFYLDPSLPKKGVDYLTLLSARYGKERAEAATKRIVAVGEAEGLKMGNVGKKGNTRDAHRLIHLGITKSNEMQDKVVTELFKSHFENHGDITERQVLIDAGVKAGLDKEEVAGWLESDKGGKEVDRGVEEAMIKDVHGVPNFTINGKYVLEGAQEPQTFLQAFVRAKMAAEDVSVSQGQTC